jgi:hypothetical protein
VLLIWKTAELSFSSFLQSNRFLLRRNPRCLEIKQNLPRSSTVWRLSPSDWKRCPEEEVLPEPKMEVRKCINVNLCLSFYLSLCLSASKSVCFSLSLNLSVSLCLLICLVLYLCLCLSLSVSLSFYLYFCLFDCFILFYFYFFDVFVDFFALNKSAFHRTK